MNEAHQHLLQAKAALLLEREEHERRVEELGRALDAIDTIIAGGFVRIALTDGELSVVKIVEAHEEKVLEEARGTAPPSPQAVCDLCGTAFFDDGHKTPAETRLKQHRSSAHPHVERLSKDAIASAVDSLRPPAPPDGFTGTEALFELIRKEGPVTVIGCADCTFEACVNEIPALRAHVRSEHQRLVLGVDERRHRVTDQAELVLEATA